MSRISNIWRNPQTGRWLLLLIVVTSFTIVTMLIVETTGGPAAFRSLIEGAGAWTPVVFVLLKAATYVIAPLSGVSIKLAAGALFGAWEGLLLSTAGDTLGASLNYWIARILGRAGIKKFAGKGSLKQVDHVASRAGGWRILLAARILLSAVYDFIAYAAGLARIPFGQFLIVTALGGIPISLFFALVGDAAVRNAAVSQILLAVFSAVLVAALLAYLYYRYQRRAHDKRTVLEETLGE